MPIDRDDIGQGWIACLKGLHEIKERYENELDAKNAEIESMDAEIKWLRDELRRNTKCVNCGGKMTNMYNDAAEIDRLRDDRPVVVPVKVEPDYRPRFAKELTHKCPECKYCLDKENDFFCFHCGAKLDWKPTK